MKLKFLMFMVVLSFSSFASGLSDAEKCKKNGGRYTATGFNRSSCIMPLADGGKKCTNSKQCLGYCEAIREDKETPEIKSELKSQKPKSIWKPYGQCSKDNRPSDYSCRARYENGTVDPVVCQ